MVKEGRMTEECQDRLESNSKNMQGMLLCLLLIILVLLANIILLYGDFEQEESMNSGVLWPYYNTKPASYLRPNIVTSSEHQP